MSKIVMVLVGASAGVLLVALGIAGALACVLVTARVLAKAGCPCPCCCDGDGYDGYDDPGDEPDPDPDPAVAQSLPRLATVPAAPAAPVPDPGTLTPAHAAAPAARVDVDPYTERQARRQIAQALAGDGPHMQERMIACRDPLPGHQLDCSCGVCWDRLVARWLDWEIDHLTDGPVA
jgi:hypothetical protein